MVCATRCQLNRPYLLRLGRLSGMQREATLKNWTTGEQVETQCSVYVMSVGRGGQREGEEVEGHKGLDHRESCTHFLPSI